MVRRVVPLAVAGAAAGVVLGVLVNAVAGEAYRAAVVIHVAPAVDPRQPAPEAAVLAPEVLAESYARLVDSRAFLAQLATRVADGELGAEALDARVDATRPEGGSLVEISATRSSRATAESLAGEIADSFLTLLRQLEQQRGVRVETALRARLDELGQAMAEAATEARLDALRAERRALTDRLASAVADAAETRSIALVAGPGGSAVQVRPHLLRNVLGGLLLGLAAGLAGALLLERRATTAPAAGPGPVDEAAPEARAEELEAAPPAEAGEARQPAVLLASPTAGSVLTGVVRLAADVSPDVERVQFLLSDGGSDWLPVADAPPRLSTAVWDTTGTADGNYWLSAIARNDEGRAAASEPTPVALANGT